MGRPGGVAAADADLAPGGGLCALIADVRAGMDGGALALALTNPAIPRSAMERVLDLAIGALLRGLAASDDAAPATKP